MSENIMITRIKKNKIYNMDCLEGMKHIPDQSIDLVLTSPPYNMGNTTLARQQNSTVGQKHYDVYNDNKDEDKYVEWIMSVINECLRISRYVFWNIQFLSSTRNAIFELQNKYRNNLKDIFIWNKQAVASITANNGGLAKGWEYVFLLGQDNLSTFKYNNFQDNKYVPNRQHWNKVEKFDNHHATFTKEMCRYFIKNFTKEQDTILDPFSGTGTTCKVAKELYRNYIGFEISEKYCNESEKGIGSISDFGKFSIPIQRAS